MRKLYLCLLALSLMAGAALAQSNVDPGWTAFIIRNGATGAPIIQNHDVFTQAVEIATWEGSQKAALGTNMLNGAKVSDIARLHIDRLDTPAPPPGGSLYGPYFNIWVTDGLGHYAVLANEPSDGEWAGSPWDVASWDFLKTKRCKVYETPGLVGTTPGTSWVYDAIGIAGTITFEDAGNLIIAPPSPAYIADGANAVGGGAPRVLGTNVAYGFNWMFGDTMANYVSGADGFVVDNYYVSQLVTNVTQSTTHATIQAAVDLANAGDLISVPGGIYTEQVHVTLNDLTIQGAGVGTTFIRSPATLPLFYGTNKPVVFIDGATGVHLDALTINGDGKGNANNRFQGIGFWNGGGALTHAAVINVMDTPFSGVQHGVAIGANNSTGSPYTLAVSDVVVEDFQKNAFALSGAGLTVDLDDITVTGAGPTPVTAQNGIQIGFGAGGTVDNCTVDGIAYTGSGWSASGVLLYLGAPVAMNNVDVTGSQTSYYIEQIDCSLAGVDVTSPADLWGLFVYSAAAKAGGAQPPAAQPMVEPYSGKGTKALANVTITDSRFIGVGAPGSEGLVIAADGPETFTMTGCEVSGWDYGVYFDAGATATFDATVTQSSLHGNASYGLYSTATQTVAATCNWWGTTSGPDVPGNPSSGDAIAGLATYQPWLDAPGGNCVLYGDNNIGVGDATACLTPANTCVTVPVTFNRTDLTASRGVSVTIQLSPNLVLCTGNPETDIVLASGPGSWLGTYTNSWPEIVDNGGGSYTIDRSVIGSPCGPTNGGLLFTVNVAMAESFTTDQIGTVTVTAVDVRDCDNASLACLPGAVGEITIDVTNPAVLTGLAATQLRIGNDSDGTTKINLAWTAPGGDAEWIDLWRKGYGHYPEYDDAGGAAPAAPVTVGNGWTHVAQVSATATTYVDEPGTRDFWSYAAYVTDACGNVSAASAITGGRLNYHLGDVIPTDNLVATSDISNLGNHYGITIAANGDPLNYLDVGPTTDRSVHARPTTDNRIQFEDLMVFAMNYDLVSKVLPDSPPAGRNAIALVGGQVGTAGSTFDVAIRLTGDGQLQGLSVPLTWDAAVATPVAVRPGDLLSGQGELALVLSPEPGVVDAALMGIRDRGIAGDGVLATVTFRVDVTGDPKVGLGAVSARDKDNQAVALSGAQGSLPPASLPAVSELRGNVPNPFNPTTEFSFVLSQSGPVSLRIYTLRGELVRTLVAGDLQAGVHALTWNGLDDQGRQAASGGYIVRFVAPDRTQSRNITLLK